MDNLIQCSPEPSTTEPVIAEDSRVEEEHQLDPVQHPADYECQVSSSAVIQKNQDNQSLSSRPPRQEFQEAESSHRSTEIEREPVSPLIDQMKACSNPYSTGDHENRWTEPFDISSNNRSDNDVSLNEGSYVYDTVTSSTSDDADYETFQSQDDKTLSQKSHDTSDISDNDSSQSYDQVECIHHRQIGSCDDCLKKIWSCTRPRKKIKKKRSRLDVDSSNDSQSGKDLEHSRVIKKQKLMPQLSSSPTPDIIIVEARKKESTILQVDQNTTGHCLHDNLSDSANMQKEGEINQPQHQRLSDKKSSRLKNQDSSDEINITEDWEESTSLVHQKKKALKLAPLPVPSDYLLLTTSKEKTILKLVQGIRRGNVIAKSKNRYCYIQVDNKPAYRAPTSTQYKNLFVMMARLRKIETLENFTARIQFGFSYIYRNDVVTKNLSDLQKIKAGHFLASVNGIQFPVRGKNISPDSIQRAIDIAFNPSFQPHVGHRLFNKIIHRRNLLESQADTVAELSYEYVTYEVTMENDENSVYIFRRRQQQDGDSKNNKKHANNNGHRVVVEKRPIKNWLSVHIARGVDENFDLKYDLFYSDRTPSDIECPFVLNNLGQIDEPIKIRKKFRQMITNVKKFESRYHESSFKTTNKSGTVSSFWDSALFIIQEVTDYDDYNSKKGVFKCERMTVEAKLEFGVDEWFDNLAELTDQDYLAGAAKEFYRLGVEASAACKMRTNPKNEADKKRFKLSMQPNII